MRISVAVRTKFHAFQLAQQLHQRGVLGKLYTSFYGKFFNKDNSKGFTIPKNQVSQNWLTAALFYGFDTQNLAVFQYFGSWVASQMGNEDLIVSFPMISLPILQRAKSLNIKTVISQASAHDAVYYQLLLDGYKSANLPTTHIHKIFHTKRLVKTSLEYEMTDYIQVPSLFVAKTFLSQGFDKKKILYAPFGVDLQIFTRPEIILPKTFRVIYVGNLTILKGVHILLEAFAKLNLPNSELYLIGSLSDEIKPFLAKYSQKNIVYIPPVSQIEVAKYLNQSSIFSINSLQDGFAQVVPQAMACGLPVVCTENVGGADLVDNHETGYIIPISNVKKLQEKLLYFYENPTEVLRMGMAAQNKVSKNYTWDKYGEKCCEFYKQCLTS